MDIVKTVATPSAAAAANAANAHTARTLMGGTAAMRRAGQTYLPKEAAESLGAYEARLLRSTLFNAFGKTVDDMTGKVFAKPVILKEDVPDQIRAFAEDIDLTGRHINLFARDVFHDAMQSGIGYILTDMPPAVQRADGKPATIADEKGQRPYLVYIPAERMLGWKSQTIGGVDTLLMVRIMECIQEDDGEFDEKEVEQVRVLEPGKWRTFRQNDKQEWVLHAEGTTSLNKITLTPFYTNRTAFMQGQPSLAKLAELNVAHWQSDSDQCNILHVARVPILFAKGFAENDSLEVSVKGAIRSSNDNADLKWVEHTGKAIEAGSNNLKDLEFRMQTMGLQLLIPKPGGQTATGEIRDEHKENSPLAMMARNLEDALEVSFGFMAEYIGLGPDAGGEIEVNKDFGVQAQRNDLQQLVATRQSGDISRETLWAEMQRRDYLSDSFDPDVENERIANEPVPGLMQPGAKPFTPGA